MVTATYKLVPIDPEAADELRTAFPDAPVFVADQHRGYPCRQCLRDAEVGEELVLVSYDPFTSDSPYRSASPIFLHRETCVRPVDTSTIPPQLSERQLSVRAFDAVAMMIDAAIVPGTELDDALRRFLADETTDHVHVHNATRGCWAVRVDRARNGQLGSAEVGTMGDEPVPRPAVEGDVEALAVPWYEGWREAHLGRVPDALHPHRTVPGACADEPSDHRGRDGPDARRVNGT